MRGFLLGFLTALVILPLGAIGLLRLGAADVRSDVPAPAWKSGLLQLAVRASVHRRAPRAPARPAGGDPGDLVDLVAGGKLYLNGCAGCHGRPGRPRRARAWFLPPPEFAYAGSRYSEAERYWIIRHGLRRTSMSAYGPFYSEKQLWSLAKFVGRMKGLPPAVSAAIQPKKP